ncbi:MAG: hypothetical protein LBP69_09820 [Treponema sp.]|jgi:hypothetical protein|nr:hypothetical protein [Treponema sp.]
MVGYSEYQGKPVIELKRDADDRYPFSFGLAKAKLIVENIEAIKEFAEGRGKEKQNDKA